MEPSSKLVTLLPFCQNSYSPYTNTKRSWSSREFQNPLMPWNTFNPIWLSKRQPTPAALRKKPFWLYNMVISTWISTRTGARGTEQTPRAARERTLTPSLTLQPVHHIPHRGDEVLVLLWVGQDNTVQSVHVGINSFHRGGFPTTYSEHSEINHKVFWWPQQFQKVPTVLRVICANTQTAIGGDFATHHLLWQILQNHVLLTPRSE